MDVALVSATARRRTHGTRGADLPRAPIVEAIAAAADLSIVNGHRGSRGAPAPFGVVVGTERFDAIHGSPAAERVQHEAQDDRARLPVHRWRPSVLDQADKAQLVGVGFDHGPMVDGVHCDLGR